MKNGNIKSSGKYIIGCKDSEWRYFDEEGGLLKIENYDDGEIIE